MAGRPRPNGGGEEEKQPVGRKKRMGPGWAERPDGPKVTGKIVF
jgi:hypothetical protein